MGNDAIVSEFSDSPLFHTTLADWEQYKAHIKALNDDLWQQYREFDKVETQNYAVRLRSWQDDRDREQEEYKKQLATYEHMPFFLRVFADRPLKPLAAIWRPQRNYVPPVSHVPTWEGFLDWLVEQGNAEREST